MLGCKIKNLTKILNAPENMDTTENMTSNMKSKFIYISLFVKNTRLFRSVMLKWFFYCLKYIRRY